MHGCIHPCMLFVYIFVWLKTFSLPYLLCMLYLQLKYYEKVKEGTHTSVFYEGFHAWVVPYYVFLYLSIIYAFRRDSC